MYDSVNEILSRAQLDREILLATSRFHLSEPPGAHIITAVAMHAVAEI